MFGVSPAVDDDNIIETSIKYIMFINYYLRTAI